MSPKIASINISAGKGGRKQPVGRAELQAGHGIKGDGHAGDWHRQVSLLALESIEKMRAKGLDVGPGDFAENITTTGIDLLELPVGSHVGLGAATIEITQHGKECHAPCEIYRQAGDCVMPGEGVFAVVIEGGVISDGEKIIIGSPVSMSLPPAEEDIAAGSLPHSGKNACQPSSRQSTGRSWSASPNAAFTPGSSKPVPSRGAKRVPQGDGPAHPPAEEETAAGSPRSASDMGLTDSRKEG